MMELRTDRFKFKELFPDKARKLAQKLHIKANEIEFVRKGIPIDPKDIEIKDGERAAIRLITTPHLDRDSEILVPHGAILDDFRQSPSVLFGHDYKSLPIGHDQWIKVVKEGILAKTAYAKHQFAEDVFQCVKHKDLNSNSVGFIPIEAVKPEDKKQFAAMQDILEKDYGIDKKESGKAKNIYAKWIMLEHSDVPVASNAQSLNLAVSKGEVEIKSKRLRKELEIEVVKDMPDREIEVSWESEEKAEEAIKEMEIEIEKDKPKTLLGLPIVEIDSKDFFDELVKDGIVTKPETTEKYHHIPVNPGCKITATITISASKGIKATYCGEVKKIHTYLFSVEKWTMEEAQAWVAKQKPKFHERWNKSLSKLFDIERVESKPSTFNYAILEKFLECNVKQIFQNSYTIPSPLLGTYLTGFKEILKGFDLKDTRNFNSYGAESPLQSEVIKLNSKISDDFLICGTRFYDAGGTPLVIDYQPTWYGIRVSISTSSENKGWNKELLEKVHDWVHENNFLKGEKFALSGDFLDESEDGWDSLVLEEKMKDSINKTTNVLIKKKEKATARGLLFIGPAGTGKTKTGRVLMNEVDSTFIWVSSRDFRRVGPLEGLALAFSLARDLAPTVLFIEDVDTWLSGYERSSVDLIKTELDGIRQNRGIVTVLTSNYPEKLPPALLDRPGRFHHIVNFELPKAKHRIKMLEMWAGDIGEALLREIAGKTDGFSGAHIKELVEFAKMIAEEDDIEIGKALIMSLEKLMEQRELIEEIRANKTDVKAVWGRVKYVEGDVRVTEDRLIEIKADEKKKFNCECIKCGHKLTSDKHCNEIKCPECGGEMRREERPGPGRGLEEEESEKEEVPEENNSLRASVVDELGEVKGTSGEETRLFTPIEFNMAIELLRKQHDELLKETNDHIADLKAGRVLSRKNRNIVKDAITALNAVLKADATGTQEDDEVEESSDVTERTVELVKDGDTKTFAIKDIELLVEKLLEGKAQNILEKAFEKQSDPEKIKLRIQEGIKLEIDKMKGKVR